MLLFVQGFKLNNRSIHRWDNYFKEKKAQSNND